MRTILLPLFIFLVLKSASAQLFEAFTDSDLTDNPTWQGDLNHFVVNLEGQLQLNASGADTSIIFTAVALPDSTVWAFEFNLDFAPSSNNRLRIYLQSSTTNYPDVDGYFLEIGESGTTDALRLFRSDNGNRTAIASATEGALATKPATAKVRVTRNKFGEWAIFANYENEDLLTLEATATDDTYLGGNQFFGLWCKNSSTNADNFFFDNISIDPLLPDLSPPQIVAVEAISLQEIVVVFDEPIDSLSATDVSNFNLINIGNPLTATWTATSSSEVLLHFNNTFTNQTSYDLDIQNVKDRAENVIVATSVSFEVNFVAPVLLGVVAISSTELELEFNKSIDTVTASLSDSYSVDDGIGNPINAEVDPIEPFRVYLELGNALQNGVTYNLRVENIKDELGLEITEQIFPFDFLVGEMIAPQDLVINEILFNPTTGGSDFVELYNRSQKFLNISDLFISNTTRTSGRDKDILVDKILRPGDYVVFTADPDFVTTTYNVQNPNFLFENPLPAFNDASGNVSLFTTYNLDTMMIDSFDYTEDFHYPLLDDNEGISLERISFEANTQDQSNWHSAASLNGGGTPTFRNSQFRPDNPADDIFEISEPVFSPDNDGFKDFLQINYALDNQGYLATIKIFDAKGRLVTTLFENQLLGLAGTIKWNGLTDEGRKARIGIYVIFAEIFSPSGDIFDFKTTCVVAGQLD
ncbi:MAG: Ig-like domain-containing protein [Bacteroidota bacterium]